MRNIVLLVMVLAAIFCINKYGWRNAGINELNDVKKSLESQQHQITYLFEEVTKLSERIYLSEVKEPS